MTEKKEIDPRLIERAKELWAQNENKMIHFGLTIFHQPWFEADSKYRHVFIELAKISFKREYDSALKAIGMQVNDIVLNYKGLLP